MALRPMPVVMGRHAAARVLVALALSVRHRVLGMGAAFARPFVGTGLFSCLVPSSPSDLSHPSGKEGWPARESAAE